MIVTTDRVLVVNARAGSLDDGARRELVETLDGYDVIELPQGGDIAGLLSSLPIADDATVVVAGGDGTVGAAARALARTGRTLGIIPLGTFNNFARALGLPLQAGAAAAVARSGRSVPVKIGRVNGRPFLEVASIGLFGDLVNLGESAKELRYGELIERLRALRPRSFAYSISGDLSLHGRARSIVISNTPSTGALVPVGEATPVGAHLELSIYPAGFRTDVLRRLFGAVLPFLRRQVQSYPVRQVRVETDAAVNVYADAEETGTTPAAIEVEGGGLRVLVGGS